METDLANYCKELGSSLTVKSLRELVFEHAERNGVSHRFSKLKKIAGKDWVFSFCKRCSLSVRVPEKTNLARAAGFNRVQVNRFFDNLKNLIEKKHILPHRIYNNMDETSILTVPNKTPKVIAPTGKKTVGKIVAAERGQLITAVCATSATGKYVPPSLIFPHKKTKGRTD
ncbi:uncharacterized protein LOC115885689 [Sitophilus oryzae]|uniref:Uncharacterized protein LOC115885689 n=1 Tax=Sitophilus oryzae TaxID=7048 RepID=A0A6J2Y9I9_SITOR|nr:uncharacterized protein LOC115885689 [Sitophilus oryzae]